MRWALGFRRWADSVDKWALRCSDLGNWRAEVLESCSNFSGRRAEVLESCSNFSGRCAEVLDSCSKFSSRCAENWIHARNLVVGARDAWLMLGFR